MDLIRNISIRQFLLKYYGFDCEGFNRLSHEELYSLMQILDVKNFNYYELSTGEIIGVYDKYGEVLYYKNPNLEQEVFYANLSTSIDFTPLKIKSLNFNYDDMSELSIYELMELLKYFKRLKQQSDVNRVKKVLRHNGKQKRGKKKVRKLEIEKREIK